MPINRVRQLTELRRHAEALAALSALSLRQPDGQEVLYLQALNLRLMGQPREALTVLNRLEVAHPRFGRLFQERGQCYLALNDVPQAIGAFLQAVRLNPALLASWETLERLCRVSGDVSGAATAAQHLATLRQLPSDVLEASALFADGDLRAAEETIRSYLRTDGRNAGALRLLARIGMECNALQEAESLLELVLRLVPDFHAARLDYAMVLLRQHKYAASRDEAQALLKQDPGHREYLKQYAAACIGLGDHEPVIAIYGQLLRDMPGTGVEVSDLRLWRANALKSMGRSSDAIAEYQAAVAARPESGVSWFSLANLKTYRFADGELARMRVLEATASLPGLDRCYLCFALGKAFEDRAEYATSWHYYERGNAIKRAGGRYRAELAKADAEDLERTCTAEFFAARTGWGVADDSPIFILGLPRSGSTLLEQILATHSNVEGTHELTEIGRYVAELAGSPAQSTRGLPPDALRRLTAQDVRRLGERFLAATQVYRRLGRPYFVDKMPDNFWHIGLIHLMLPNAKIVDARREPMACCVGNLKQLFGMAQQEFSYGIEDVARHYGAYLGLMQHWTRVLPGKVLTVQHEDVVNDLEGSVRRLLAHCALPFEPACIEFHTTRRAVQSASSEQVRQPLSRDGLSQWRHYEPWLGRLKSALGDSLTRYRQ